jgi:hypothetical protein
MKYNFKKRYYIWVILLFLSCARDTDNFDIQTDPISRLEIASLEGLKFDGGSIKDGTKFNFKTQTAGIYTLEIRDHFKILISKSIINAKIGDNVLTFYTKALQEGDYNIIIYNYTSKVQETKMTIQ